MLAGLLLLFLLSPLFIVLAIAIKVDSRGPVLFRQIRMGSRRVGTAASGQELWALEPFWLFKFRSMAADADESVHARHIEHFTKGIAGIAGIAGNAENAENAGRDGGKSATPAFKLTADSRVTRVGRVLRRWSLDELPQLLNVVMGQMSLVGPRPVPLYEVAGYDSAACYERFAAKPGLTGLWQISGRGNLSFHEMMALDRQLIERRSLVFEFSIVVKTIPAVARGAGAS